MQPTCESIPPVRRYFRSIRKINYRSTTHLWSYIHLFADVLQTMWVVRLGIYRPESGSTHQHGLEWDFKNRLLARYAAEFSSPEEHPGITSHESITNAIVRHLIDCNHPVNRDQSSTVIYRVPRNRSRLIR